MKFNIITIFPDLISNYGSESILGRAQKKDKIQINAVNLRDFAEDKHKQVDDTPYGGGAGMVMKPEPIFKALASLDALKQDTRNKIQETNKKTFLLSPRGKQFDQRMAEELSKLDEITFVCGRYEGVDQRVSDHMVDEEISVGPYVLAGGELGALIITEAVSRLVPGVLGNPESLIEETHGLAPNHLTTQPPADGKSGEVVRWSGDTVEYPQYTKPEKFMDWSVPQVLLSGHHAEIEKWRKSNIN